jgi:hypothetical protein
MTDEAAIIEALICEMMEQREELRELRGKYRREMWWNRFWCNHAR